MTGGRESAAGDRDGVPMATAHVPVGWQRRVEAGAVAYISPSGTILGSVEEVRAYLLTDSTCKCGLECPLVLHKVFNFDPGTVVREQGQQHPGKAEDMTKLCNHRRKVVAMAALCRSMHVSQIALPAHGAGGPFCPVDGRDQRGLHPDGAHSAYSTQPRPLTPSKPSGSLPPPPALLFVQNGSSPHSASPLLSDANSISKKHPPQPPGCSVIGYGKQQWYPRPPASQAVIQRLAHGAASPSPAKLGAHAAVYSSEPPSSSSASPSYVPAGARTGQSHPLGASVNSPAPLSVCPSPSPTLDSTSPHQRSRHSSASSTGGKASCPSLSPLPPTTPCASPKGPPPPASPRSRLEGMLQHYRDGAGSPQHPHLQSNQSNFQLPQSLPPHPYGSAAGVLGLPLGQLLTPSKGQPHVPSFPASSLLSAAAKAQLANQRNQNQNQAEAADPGLPAAAPPDKEPPQSKVLISTLSSSIPRPPAKPQPMAAFLLPHSPSLPQSPASLTEKTSRRKRQRRSPTVLSMLKESQLGSLRAGTDTPLSPLSAPPSSSSSSSSSSSATPSSNPLPSLPPHTENHLHGPWPPAVSPHAPPLCSEEARRLGVLLPPGGHPPATQPLSALLQLLSMQTGAQPGPAPPPPKQTPASPAQYDVPPSAAPPQPQSVDPSLAPLATLAPPHIFPLMEELDGASGSLKPGANGVLNLSQAQTGGGGADASAQLLGLMSQLAAGSALPALPDKPSGTKPGESRHPDHAAFPPHQHGQGTDPESECTVVSVDTQDSTEPRLLGPCGTEPGLALPGGAADLSVQLAESFPFMNQDQLLQLLSANAGLPSLLPPFLGALPMGLWAGNQPPAPAQQQQSGLFGQPPPLGVFSSSVLGAQGDFPLNLVGLLNPAPPPPPPPPLVAVSPQGQAGDGGEKLPGLQALLMASLLLSQTQAAPLLPVAGLGQLSLDIPLPQHQQLPEGMSLEKAPGLLDSLLTGPGLLEALQGLAAPPGEGGPPGPQSLLLAAALPPPALLSLNPALLAAALGPAEPLPSPQQPLPAHSQGTLASPALGSTSVPCATLLSDVVDPLAPGTEQEKSSPSPSQLLSPLLPPAALGDLATLGNINNLHGLLGAGPLLLSQVQGPALGMALPQGQGPLNPLACLLNSLQLSVGPALGVGDKPLGMPVQEPPPPPHEEPPAAQLSQEPGSNPGHGPRPPPPQREAEPLFDPYGSFMDTIYTSFLQVSGRGAEPLGEQHPLSYPTEPPQPSAPPSLSPRRACSVHNPDLSRLGMEAAQSPARGTPKLSEASDAPPPSKPAGSEGHGDTPLPPAFMEEAKTDGSSAVCFYSNGVASGLVERAGEEDGAGGGRAEPQGYLSPGDKLHGDGMDNSIGPKDTDQGSVLATRTGPRRGRKRKQILQRGSDGPGDLDRIIEDPGATIALPKLVKSARGKRRRVVR